MIFAVIGMLIMKRTNHRHVFITIFGMVPSLIIELEKIGGELGRVSACIFVPV